MNYLILGLGLFAGMHFFSMLLPGYRDTLKRGMGEGPYRGIYAFLSLLGIALVAWGYSIVSNGPEAGELAYIPLAPMRHVTMLLVLLAFVCIGAAHGRGYLKLWLRNPMSIGVALWATGHLLSNGRYYDVLIFGILLLLALFDITLSTARGKVPTHLPRLRSDVIAVIVGIVLFVIFLFGFHPYVLRVPIVT
jgi:uncharacterized membrane protein